MSLTLNFCIRYVNISLKHNEIALIFDFIINNKIPLSFQISEKRGKIIIGYAFSSKEIKPDKIESYLRNIFIQHKYLLKNTAYEHNFEYLMDTSKRLYNLFLTNSFNTHRTNMMFITDNLVENIIFGLFDIFYEDFENNHEYIKTSINNSLLYYYITRIDWFQPLTTCKIIKNILQQITLK